MNKSGFTLVELIVSIFISTMIIGGVFFIFSSVSNNLTTIRYLDHTYDTLTNFKSDYSVLKKNNPLLVTSTGGTSVWADIGFQAIVFSNSGQTTGFLLASEDVLSGSIIVGAPVNYSHFSPVLLSLTGGQIANASANMTNFLSGLALTSANTYPNLNILKLNYTSINNSTIGKLDLTIIPAYFDVFQGVAMTTFLAHPLYQFYPFSLLR